MAYAMGPRNNNIPATGVFESEFVRQGGWYTGNDNDRVELSFNASRSSSIYGKRSTVQPNSLVFNYIIKY